MNETVITKRLDRKELHVERLFNGPLDLVWKAWTTPALLDKWWAPKPWKTVTKSMDFREGGYWLYSMNGPEKEQHWARADYMKINLLEMYEATDAFCDEHGNINSEIPSMHWRTRFNQTQSGTNVSVIISFPSEEALEKIIEMGFNEGFTAAHGNLDDILKEELANVRD